MRILYFAPHAAWPLTTGARLRDYHLARQLGSRCSVFFAGLQAPGDQPSPEPPATSNFQGNVTLTRGPAYTPLKILRGLIGPVPVTLLNYFDQTAATALCRLIDQWQIDAVQMESVHLMPYLPFIRATRKKPAVLIDWHNIESELMYRYAARAPNMARKLVAMRTARLIARREDRLLAKCPIHTVCSDREKAALDPRAPTADIRVVPNGVDVESFSDGALAALHPAPVGSAGGTVVLFVGSMDYHANSDAVLWFVQQIWPTLKKRRPDARFVVAGRNPPPQISALASSDITITGTVEDVRPWYRCATVVVVPIRTGSGTRLKILEAMAVGVPVVSTRAGAEGILVTDGSNIILADDEKSMAQSLDQVITLPELRQQLRERGRQLVCDRYDWSISGKLLYEAHCRLLETARL